MNPLRRIIRAERKRLVKDFKREQNVSNKQLGAFCFVQKQPITLNGKVNTIIDLYIKTLEEKYAAEAEKLEAAAESNAVTIDSIGEDNGR